MLAKLYGQLVQKVAAKLRMRDRSPTEENGQFDLVSPIQESRCLPPLRLQIVPANLWLDTNFLESRYMLIAPGIALFSTLLVPKLPVIHQPTNGRRGVRGHFHEVKPPLPSHFHRFPGWNDANLASLIVD